MDIEKKLTIAKGEEREELGEEKKNKKERNAEWRKCQKHGMHMKSWAGPSNAAYRLQVGASSWKTMENTALVWPKNLFLSLLLDMPVPGLTWSFNNRYLSEHLVLSCRVKHTRAGAMTNRFLPARSWRETGMETIKAQCHSWFWFYIAHIFSFSELNCCCSRNKATKQSLSLWIKPQSKACPSTPHTYTRDWFRWSLTWTILKTLSWNFLLSLALGSTKWIRIPLPSASS